MSKRQKSLFKFAVIIPWIIMICIVFSLQMQCENSGQEKPGVLVQTGEDIIRLEMELSSYLQNMFKQLKDLFAAGEFEKMADLFISKADKMNLYDLTGTKLISRDQIRDFWKDAKENKEVTELGFTVLNLRVVPVAECPAGENPDDIIATGHAVFVYRLVKNSGAEVSNHIGSGTYDAPHPRRCEW
jgi:hypothetical protein